MITVVVREAAGRVAVAPAQQPANSPSTFQRPRKISSPCITHRRCVAAVSFLDHPHPVIQVANLVVWIPTAAGPTVVDPLPQPAPTVVGKLAPPRCRHLRADQLVLGIIRV